MKPDNFAPGGFDQARSRSREQEPPEEFPREESGSAENEASRCDRSFTRWGAAARRVC